MLYQCNCISMLKTPVRGFADLRSNLFVSFDMVLVVSFSFLTGCIASCDYFNFIGSIAFVMGFVCFQ